MRGMKPLLHVMSRHVHKRVSLQLFVRNFIPAAIGFDRIRRFTAA
jgi:hypothetical protein